MKIHISSLLCFCTRNNLETKLCQINKKKRTGDFNHQDLVYIFHCHGATVSSGLDFKGKISSKNVDINARTLECINVNLYIYIYIQKHIFKQPIKLRSMAKLFLSNAFLF